MINVLLIGFGHFGKSYYNELCLLEKEDKLRLSAIVTRSPITSRVSINHKNVLMQDLTEAMLNSIDLIIIVTPADSHIELVQRFRKYAHILLEKPIVTNQSQIQKINDCDNSQFTIFPAQIFRFHPLISWLKENIALDTKSLKKIDGTFINKSDKPLSSSIDPSLEMNHFIDLTHYLFPTLSYEFSSHEYVDDYMIVNAVYSANKNIICHYKLGWNKNRGLAGRAYTLVFDKKTITIDFQTSIITIKFDSGEIKKEKLNTRYSLIKAMLINLINHIENRTDLILPTTKEAIKLINDFSTQRQFSDQKHAKKVAVIGGGIFGACTAIELADTFQVDLFEKESDLLLNASYRNQWRHHSGFHYPLSHSTIQEIIETKQDFEKVFSDCLHSNIPAYYFVSAEAEEIPAERYLSTCDLYGLNYKLTPPPAGIDPNSISLTLLTDEKIYDIAKIRDKVKAKINKLHSISLYLNTSVDKIDFLQTGSKQLKYTDQNKKKHIENYDFVVDCTNASASLLSDNLKPNQENIRFEIVELLQLELDIDPCCLTVIDGPFVSLTSMGEKNKFMLSHRDHSVHSRFYSKNGPRANEIKNFVSNAENILSSAIQYFPKLKDARNVKSFISVKAISPYHNEVWERPTVIRDHGLGMLSVIGGKVLTAVSNAKEISFKLNNIILK